MTLPPTASTLYAALRAAGGTLPYRDPAVTTSGLTALEKRGLARVHAPGRGMVATVRLTEKGTP